MKILSDKIKQQIYNEYQNTGISMPELSRKYNTSISSIYRLRKDIESANLNSQKGGMGPNKNQNQNQNQNQHQKLANEKLINEIVDKNNSIFNEKYRESETIVNSSPHKPKNKNIIDNTSDKTDHKRKVKEDLTEFLEFIQSKKEERVNNI